jgi:hypothetical protein
VHSIREPILRQISIADLRPTQITVGLREVAAKRAQWRALGKKRKAFLAQHIVPVVRVRFTKKALRQFQRLSSLICNDWNGTRSGSFLITGVGSTRLIPRANGALMQSSRRAWKSWSMIHTARLLARCAKVAVMLRIRRRLVSSSGQITSAVASTVMSSTTISQPVSSKR